MLDAVGHLRDAFFAERQAIKQRRLQTGRPGGVNITMIRLKNCSRVPSDARGDLVERKILGLCIGASDSP